MLIIEIGFLSTYTSSMDICPDSGATASFYYRQIQSDYRESISMGGNENDGYYCTICGGIPPDRITTKRVLIDGKETGIDHLDWIFSEVRKLAVNNDDAVTEEILKRVKQFNYVPTKKIAEYGAGLLAAYKKFRDENP